MKACKKSVITVKLINEDLNEKNDSDKKNSKDSMLSKTIKFFFSKELLSDNLDNKELKLPFLPSLYCL